MPFDKIGGTTEDDKKHNDFSSLALVKKRKQSADHDFKDEAFSENFHRGDTNKQKQSVKSSIHFENLYHNSIYKRDNGLTTSKIFSRERDSRSQSFIFSLLIVFMIIVILAISLTKERLRGLEMDTILRVQQSRMVKSDNFKNASKFFLFFMGMDINITLLVALFFFSKSLVAFKISILLMVQSYIVMMLKYFY